MVRIVATDSWIFIVLAVVIIVAVMLAPFLVGRRFFTSDARRRMHDTINNDMYAPPPGDPWTGAAFPADTTEEHPRK